MLRAQWSACCLLLEGLEQEEMEEAIKLLARGHPGAGGEAGEQGAGQGDRDIQGGGAVPGDAWSGPGISCD